MNKYNKGLQFEIKLSKTIHEVGVPLLVEPLVLRKRGCGQIDLARFEMLSDGILIKLFEVKSSSMISSTQRSRLKKSAIFLSAIFDMPCRNSVIFSCLSKH